MSLKLEEFTESDIKGHLEYLYNTVIQLSAQVILELGVRSGESTKAFLEACKETGGKLISIDIVDCSQVSADKHWQFIQSDDLDIPWDKDIDILFIDTSHTYEQTLAELKKFAPYVKKGGKIILHDTVVYPDVLKALEDYCGVDQWRGRLAHNQESERAPGVRIPAPLFENFNNDNGLGVLTKG